VIESLSPNADGEAPETVRRLPVGGPSAKVGAAVESAQRSLLSARAAD